MSKKYTADQLAKALKIAEERTIAEASKETGVAISAIKWHRMQRRKKGQPPAPYQKDAHTNPKANQQANQGGNGEANLTIEPEPEKPVKKKTGRPRKFDHKTAEQAYKLCLLGATNEELADFFETSTETIRRWQKEEPQFRAAIKDGKSKADAEVAAKLYHRAKGYSHQETKVFNNQGVAMEVPITKHYPPDTTAAIYWLKNRQPKKWRDKHEVDMNAEVVQQGEFTEQSIRDTFAYLYRDSLSRDRTTN